MSNSYRLETPAGFREPRLRRVTTTGIVVLVAVLAAGAAFFVPKLFTASEPAYDGASFFLREVRRDSLDVEGMHPYVLSPLSTDRLSEFCPSECQLYRADDTYAEIIGPYTEALGAVALPREPKLEQISEILTREWESIRAMAQAPPADPPLRIVTNVYARKGDPGHCVTIRATFNTAPDPLFDREAARAPALAGVLYMFWKTYQLAGDEPKLIEAGIEVTTDIKTFGWRRDFATIAKPADLPQSWTRDELAGGHFYGFGGGRRYGIVWLDRGAGTKAASPWSAAYTIEQLQESNKPQVTLAELPASWETRLLHLIERL